jgi:aspartyl/asparaginyl beta-hydroxylase (cupin superfamily)
MVYYIIIIIIIILWLFPINNSCIIPFQNYPELNVLYINKQIIVNELLKVINSNRWTLYDNLHNKSIFKNNDINSVNQMMTRNYTKLNSSDIPNWKLFGLVYNKQIFDNNDQLCPQTIKLLLNIPSVINAGFSCLEPGKVTDLHTDNNNDFYRVQFPLIIPEGNCGFKINNQIFNWSKPFIFNDSCYHQAWNMSNSNRFVLILDILK